MKAETYNVFQGILHKLGLFKRAKRCIKQGLVESKGKNYKYPHTVALLCVGAADIFARKDQKEKAWCYMWAASNIARNIEESPLQVSRVYEQCSSVSVFLGETFFADQFRSAAKKQALKILERRCCN